jgi:PKD repeat protein
MTCITSQNHARKALKVPLTGSSILLIVAVLAVNAPAATLYVDFSSLDPVSPYGDWGTAATNIQDAVDAATVGDLILVTNGNYRAGGRVAAGALTNRVVIDKAVTVQSVNGPAVTAIEGNPVMGDSAVRCVYLGANSRLAGFTIRNGATRSAGDTTLEQSGGGLWCESASVVVSNCVLVSNSAAYFGGGASSGTLYRCILSGNFAGYRGGGAYASTLSQCQLIGNSAGVSAGGARESSLNNCLVVSNSAMFTGGAEWATLNNCTVVANAGGTAGGVSVGNATNCIIYYNSGSEPNYQTGIGSTLDHCCTAPLPDSSLGAGNFVNPPVFVNQAGGDFHLLCDCSCVNAGNNAAATGAADLDGNPRIVDGVVDVGAYEFHLTAPLAVSIQKDPMDLLTNYPAAFVGTVDIGCARTSYWDFGDGTIVSNQLVISHAWTSVGTYPVVLRAFNELNPAGVGTTTFVQVATQRIHYVDVRNLNPVAPYASWATAATKIQDAIDAALPVPNSVVLVTNGVYQAGGAVVYGTLTNRVALTKPIVVQSVNGPAVTQIQGYAAPGWGANSVRCAYLTNGAALLGFTLSGGSSQLTDSSGGGVWCESTNAFIANCVLSNNTAYYAGGGAYGGTLSNCTLTANLGHSIGGGVYGSVLKFCALSSNTAAYPFGDGGGGSRACTLLNCTLTGNSANYGGGDFGSVLYNCALTANAASQQGGGACNSTLYNCTVTGNTAGSGGGAFGSTLNNCLVLFNNSGSNPNYATSILNYCCALPLPASGSGNIAADPALADATHLSAGSPCHAAGSSIYASGLDIDGEPWASPPSIGCDEYHAGAISGPLSVTLQASASSAVVGFGVNFTGQVLGHATSNRWDFGDGNFADNRPGLVSHNWTAPGDYTVTFRAYNESFPTGTSASVLVHVVDEVHYVALESLNPVAPFASWATAATNIQDAVDAAVLPGATVLVSNGVYHFGGRVVNGSLSNRVAVAKNLVLKSVNGPAVTVIQGRQVPGTTNGSGAVACVYLTNGASLVGFTITNGATLTSGATSGGGVWCSSADSVVSNCVLIGNAAYSAGGGAYRGTLQNCSLIGNLVLAPGTYPGAGGGGPSGGGAWGSTLSNCTVVGNLGFLGGGIYGGTGANCTVVSNTAAQGGGAYNSSLANCTVAGNSATNRGGGIYQGTINNTVAYYNSAPSDPNYYGATVNYFCTTPLPSGGVGNFTNAPLFVDTNNWSNLRLQTSSPCINSGRNAYAPAGLDPDRNPRISGGTVDVGAYEFQNPASVISYAWLQQYGLPIDGTADTVDSDHDGMNNWQEWRAGTDPTNALSLLQVLAPTNAVSGITVTWQSVTNRSYYLQRSLDLSAHPLFVDMQSNIVGQAGTTTYTDTNVAGAGPFFYRVGVQ